MTPFAYLEKSAKLNVGDILTAARGFTRGMGRVPKNIVRAVTAQPLARSGSGTADKLGELAGMGLLGGGLAVGTGLGVNKMFGGGLMDQRHRWGGGLVDASREPAPGHLGKISPRLAEIINEGRAAGSQAAGLQDAAKIGIMNDPRTGGAWGNGRTPFTIGGRPVNDPGGILQDALKNYGRGLPSTGPRYGRPQGNI